jgi:hypothetical protein
MVRKIDEFYKLQKLLLICDACIDYDISTVVHIGENLNPEIMFMPNSDTHWYYQDHVPNIHDQSNFQYAF